MKPEGNPFFVPYNKFPKKIPSRDPTKVGSSESSRPGLQQLRGTFLVYAFSSHFCARKDMRFRSTPINSDQNEIDLKKLTVVWTSVKLKEYIQSKRQNETMYPVFSVVQVQQNEKSHESIIISYDRTSAQCYGVVHYDGYFEDIRHTKVTFGHTEISMNIIGQEFEPYACIQRNYVYA